MGLAETKLWEALRKLKCNIRPQAPMGRYIADFIQHGAALVIEVDSAWHDFPDAQLRDMARDAWFESQGYRVLRIRDAEVFDDLEAVARKIAAAVGCKIENLA